jgi:hypothetical protein
MTTKDLLYLTAVALAALLAYCHGFFSGFARARRIYDSLLGQPEVPATGKGTPQSSAPPTPKPASASHAMEFPTVRNRLSGQDLQGDFGNN